MRFSIVSGTEVCKALRSRGHQAILVDVFFRQGGAHPATAFDGDYDVDAEAAYISSFNAQVKMRWQAEENSSVRV